MGNEDEEKPSQAEEKQEEDSSSDDYSEYTDSDYDELDVNVDEGHKEEDEEENFEEEFKKKLAKKIEEEKAEEEELWNFPPDREHWTEEDLGEHWEDYWGDTRNVGWDPNMISERSWEKYEKLWEEGKPGPPGTPYYVPYRKFYPPIPDNHFDIQTPEEVVEELERTEEFLLWYSYLFKNGSSYEGTVWDDLAHGKGVYTTAFDLIRYEGDWFQNMMRGHGVIEADVPIDEPLPDTEEAEKAREEGQLLRSDYMNPFDREWFKMDAEEQFEVHGSLFTSWVEKEGWFEEYEEYPEKGHYKYAGQWKNSRFHGCGVYQINGRTIWGKFYFGELLPDPEECTADFSAFHAGLAEVAAAKARMFANKPDGMVRQVKGPFTDPSHPYMYEEEDLWMAPGFINNYYEVPQDWKVYVEELDGEREMWLNSFYKAPFVVPMPPELEYLWSQEDEYVLLGNSPSAMLDLNPENLERASEDLQGEVLLHVPTGRIINWVTDKEGKLRFFYQPITENGEVVPEAIIPIPTGFEEALKEEEDASEKVDSGNKNFFQKLKDAWMKTSEDYRNDRERRKEELKQKWKQEDQVAEYRRKLKKAERNLARQIDIEKIRAKRSSKSTTEEEPADLDESLQEQREQIEEAKGSEAETDESKEEEESKESEEKDLQENQEEIQVDIEDDKKPRSFGKVAMLIIEDKLTGSTNKKHESQERGFIFPTAFASLTLGSKMDAGEILKLKMGGVIADLFGRRERSNIHNVSSYSTSSCFSQEQKSSLQFRSSTSGKFRMSTCRASQKSTGNTLRRATCGRGKQEYMRKTCGPPAQYSGKYMSGPLHQTKENYIWMKPEFEFLSMALPLEPLSGCYL